MAKTGIEGSGEYGITVFPVLAMPQNWDTRTRWSTYKGDIYCE